MQLSQTPPTRKSILQTGVVKPFGPHQRMKRSGSAQAFQTSSRGASNMRSMTRPGSSDSAAGSFDSTMFFLLLLAEPEAHAFARYSASLSKDSLQPVPAGEMREGAGTGWSESFD